MELRQLTTEPERQTFERYLTRARETRGRGFREREGSRNGRQPAWSSDCLGPVGLVRARLGFARGDHDRCT